MINILQAALIIVGFQACTHVGMILFFVRRLGDEYLNYYVRKMLYGCLVCMSSLYGTIYYLLTYEFHMKHYLLFIFSLAGILYIIDQLTSRDIQNSP